MNNAELADEIERQLRLRDDDSVSMRAEQWQQIIAALRRQPSSDQVLVPRSFLEATPCPNCDGSGFIVNTGPDPQQEQCQWCYEKHMLLASAEAEGRKS